MPKKNVIGFYRQFVMQGLYCGITALIAFGLSKVVGNIITILLIIAVTTLYIRLLKLFFDAAKNHFSSIL